MIISFDIAIKAVRIGWIVDAGVDTRRRRGACIGIARVINDQEITACSSVNNISAEASIDRVVAGAAHQVVVARSAEDRGLLYRDPGAVHPNGGVVILGPEGLKLFG